MSFIEQFEAAGKELEKAMKEGGAMILIASDVQDVDSGLSYISGNLTTAVILLTSLAHTDKQFRKMLKTALIFAEWREQMDNK